MVSCILLYGVSCSCTFTGAAMYHGYVIGNILISAATGFGVIGLLMGSLCTYILTPATVSSRLAQPAGAFVESIAPIRLAKL